MKDAAPERVPVSRRAVEQRITRALRKENKSASLRRSKTPSARESFGEYFVIDESTNAILASRFDLEEYARKLKAIAGWEFLEGLKGE